MEDFAQRGIDEGGSVIDLLVGEMNVGDLMIISDDEQISNCRVDDAGAGVIGVCGIHGGEMKNGASPAHCESEGESDF